jgi:hypothetical protein
MLHLASLFSLIYKGTPESVCHWQAALPANIRLGWPSLMFAGKAGAYPSEAPFRCSTLGWVPVLTHKH